ncbi:MAG: hypothetical protein ABIP94_16065 [Planctomycetota bacterium]
MTSNCQSLLLLAALSVVTGCSGSAPYAALSIEDDAEMTSNVVVADSQLHDLVRIGSPFVERVPGTNQLKVAVPIRNIGNDSIQILAQMSYLNRQKQPIGDDTNQQVKLLAPGNTITYVAISKQADADDWVLRIAWNR